MRAKFHNQKGGQKKLTLKRPIPAPTLKELVPPRPVEYYSWVEGGEYLDSGGRKYILPNNTRFPKWIIDEYKEYQATKDIEWDCERFIESKGKEAEDIFSYQKFVRAYMNYQSPYRGLLLYYGLGSGKTRAALEIARAYRRDLAWTVIFISPAALVDNFVEEMGKWGLIPKTKARYITSLKTRKSRVSNLREFGFYVVSYDAPNKVAQLQEALEEGAPGTKPRLRDKIIIVDEAHNMAQFIHNGLNQKQDRAKRATALDFYNTLYGATNCRFIFLSGTPMINIPSELSIIFNILRGPMRFRPAPSPLDLKQKLPKSVRDDKDFYPVFPIEKDAFDKIFINWKTLTIPRGRAQLFKQRIMGLVAYYSGARGDVYPSIVNKGGELTGPGEEPWTLVEVPMSRFQVLEYEEVRMIERESVKLHKVAEKATKGEKEGNIQEILEAARETQDKLDSTFRIKSRQISNFALPKELEKLRPRSISTEPEKLGDLYDEFDKLAGALDDTNIFTLENLENFSPKMKAMLEQIKEIQDNPRQDGNVLVYSNFRSIEGIEIFARVLENNGYQYFNPVYPDLTPVPSNGKPRFAILGKDWRTGQDNTTEIVRIFNSEDNKDGKIIKILLGTSNIAEGISLFNIRLVLIMEPHWNMVRINQVIGRARRICSHRALARDKWNFQVYIYLSVIPEEYEWEFPEKISTDQALYEVAIRKEKVKSQFIHLIKEAAVDCLLNATHNKNLEQDPPVSCLNFPDPPVNELVYSYYPNIVNDAGTIESAPLTRVEVSWAPYMAIKHPKFIDKNTGRAIYAVIVDPKTSAFQMSRIKIRGEGDKEFIAQALYDRDQLENAGVLVIKGYLVQGKPAWPLEKAEKIEIIEEYFSKK